MAAYSGKNGWHRILHCVAAICTTMLSVSAGAQDAPPADAAAGQDHVVSADPVSAAREVFDQWIGAFRRGDYGTQWTFNDPRKRYWVKRDRWSKMMKRSVRQHGEISEFEIYAASPATAEQLPCTEQGHCFRKEVDYVLFMIRSRYDGDEQPQQPEWTVMSMSDEGWRYAGGTFPFHPVGETGVLLDRDDEKRYRSMKSQGNSRR